MAFPCSVIALCLIMAGWMASPLSHHPTVNLPMWRLPVITVAPIVVPIVKVVTLAPVTSFARVVPILKGVVCHDNIASDPIPQL